MSDFSQLLSLINARNNPVRLLTANNVTVSDPVPATREGSDVNTKVTVTGKPGHGYYGSVDIYYKRLSLADIFTEAAKAHGTTQLTPQQIIDAVNNSYDLKLQVNDFENFTVPTVNADEAQTLALSASVDSLLVTGNFDVVVQYGKPTLIETTKDKVLDTFVHPVDRVDIASAKLMTWSKDFSSLQTALRRQIKTSSYNDWPAVKKAAGLLGIPSWTQGTVIDANTSDISDANPAFERVVIQRGVTSSGMVGDLFFHFNLF